MDKVPGSSLTVFTSEIGSWGLSTDEHQKIEDAFDNTRLFIDVHVRSPTNLYDKMTLKGTRAEECVSM